MDKEPKFETVVNSERQAEEIKDRVTGVRDRLQLLHEEAGRASESAVVESVRKHEQEVLPSIEIEIDEIAQSIEGLPEDHAQSIERLDGILEDPYKDEGTKIDAKSNKARFDSAIATLEEVTTILEEARELYRKLTLPNRD